MLFFGLVILVSVTGCGGDGEGPEVLLTTDKETVAVGEDLNIDISISDESAINDFYLAISIDQRSPDIIGEDWDLIYFPKPDGLSFDTIYTFTVPEVKPVSENSIMAGDTLELEVYANDDYGWSTQAFTYVVIE